VTKQVDSEVTAILLAAGESRRMGEFKQLLPFKGKSFVECCVDTLLASHVSRIIVVTGHREADVRAALEARPVTTAYNTDYKSGMASSIKRGVEALPPDARAILIALVDQPQIAIETVNHIIETYETHRPLIVVPTCRGRDGHPVLLDSSLKQEVLDMDPGQGLRQVVRSHLDRTIRTEVGNEDVLVDFDFPDEYRSRKD